MQYNLIVFNNSKYILIPWKQNFCKCKVQVCFNLLVPNLTGLSAVQYYRLIIISGDYDIDRVLLKLFWWYVSLKQNDFVVS